MKAFFQKTRWLFVIAAVIVLLDQVSKYFVRTYIPAGGSWAPWPWLYPYARLYHINNSGVAFGMFQGNNILFSIVAALVAIAIVYYYPSIPEKDKVLRFAMAMQLGGAIGNLIDRVTIGHVTDFMSVGNFAIFNVADSCITVGVGVLLIGVWLQDRREKKQKKELETAETLQENTDKTNS